MQQNILKSSNVVKIFLKYADGKGCERKETVKLRYMDQKSCYFAGQTIVNFTKPKWRTKAEIIIYTPDGIYSAVVILRDTEFSLNSMMYKLDIPKTWKFTQLRSGSRKKIELPVNIKFNDGLEINGITNDLSVGGFSVVSTQELSTIHRRFICTCSIQFSKEAIINFPDGILEADAVFIRQKMLKEGYEQGEQKLLCFKFKDLSADNAMILKNFLIKIE